MKQHHLSTKFLMFYVFIGVLGFFLVTLGGSYMVEKHFEHSLSAALYTEAHNIASNDAVKNNISSATVDNLQEHLSAIADFQDAVLWIINSNGEIIVSTRKDIDINNPILTLPNGEVIIIRLESFIDILIRISSVLLHRSPQI